MLFDKSRTKEQLEGLFKAGLQQGGPYWNFGFPILTASFPTLKYGIWWIVAPENVGKCAADKVLLASGGYRFISDLKEGDQVMTLGDTCLEPHRVVRLVHSGVKPAFRVRLHDGAEVVVSAEHPFLCRAGWVTLADLQVGAEVGVPNALPCGNEARPAKELRLLGYLIGDGSMSTHSALFTNANPEILADFQACLPEGFEVVEQGRAGNCVTLRVRKIGGHNAPDRRAGFRQWCEEMGIWGKRAWEKSLPDWVYTLNREGVVEILRGLIATDGHVTRDGKMLEYSTTSRDLAYGMKKLLLRLGVRARVALHHGARPGRRDAWRLTVGAKGSQIDRLYAELRVPGKSSGLHPCVDWVKIVDIDPLGEMEVFDIEVEGTHNFIGGDDIFLHNSMFEVNLGLNVLAHNENVYWLDFSLDDSVDERLGYVLARHGGQKIDDIHSAGELTTEQKAARKKAFGQFFVQHGERYHLIAISDRDKDAGNDPEAGEEAPAEEPVPFSVEAICEMIMAARQQIGKDARLFVTIDGFHDMMLQAPSTSENDRQRQKSQHLKKWAQRAKALCVVSTHSIKNSRQRGLTADVIKGDGTMLYDGKIISQLYCDVNLNRENAVVCWYDEQYPDEKLPVWELDVLKNKCGGKKKVVFYNYLPGMCWGHEVDPDTQSLYRSYLYTKKAKS